MAPNAGFSRRTAGLFRTHSPVWLRLRVQATARRAPAQCALDVTGTWNLTVVLSEGGGNPVFTFKQDGEKLTGRYQGAFGEADVTGAIKGNEIMFCFKIGDPAEPVSYSGAVDGDAMKGKVPFGSYGGALSPARKRRRNSLAAERSRGACRTTVG
jgi:hypothetical protein